MDARELIQEVNRLLTVPDESGYTHKITAIKLIRQETGLGLLESKGIADVLSGWKAVPTGEWQEGVGYRPLNPTTAQTLQKDLKAVESRHDHLLVELASIITAVRDSKTFVEFKKRLAKVKED